MEDRTMSRSLKIAAAASAAGAACLSLGLFLAVAKDSRAGDGVDVWTVSGDDDVIKHKDVQVFSLSDGDGEWYDAKSGYLGVDVREDTKSDEGGAYVNHVVEDSPADKGGMKDGDVIVGFGGDVVRGPAKLTQKIHATKPGDKVVIDVRRDGRTQKINVEMGKRPEAWSMYWKGGEDFNPMTEEQVKALRESLKGLENLGPEIEKSFKGNKFKFYSPRGGGYAYVFGRKPLLGVELVSTTPELREAMGARKDAGVLIGKVIEDSAAAKAGVKAGDLILSVDGAAVADAGDLGDELEERAGKTVDLEIVRDKRTIHLKATLPAIEEDEPRGPRAQLLRLPALPPLPPFPPVAPVHAAPAAPAAPSLPRVIASMFV
jgi:predicted metalloprotease with PDZ domain